MWFAYATIWISCAAACIYGMYITKDTSVLWFMFIPLFVSLKRGGKTEDD